MALLGPGGGEAAEPGSRVAKAGRLAKSQESTTVHVHRRYVECPLTFSFCIMPLLLDSSSVQLSSRYPRSSLIRSKARWNISSMERVGGGAVVLRMYEASEREAPIS